MALIYQLKQRSSSLYGKCRAFEQEIQSISLARLEKVGRSQGPLTQENNGKGRSEENSGLDHQRSNLFLLKDA